MPSTILIIGNKKLNVAVLSPELFSIVLKALFNTIKQKTDIKAISTGKETKGSSF